ncbi:ABC transporter permease [Actinokineospora soli]|uniref:ABC transporter permease n=1 Tax=Actinokineospora soli TaxID=1048753 RepID=A0ABW2TU18_9PSEU
MLWRGRTLDLALRSLALAGAVTAACVVIGVLAAWLVVRSDLPGRRVFGVLLVLPLAVPSYVAGFTWLAVAPGLTGFAGAFLVLTLVSYPYVLLPVAAALRTADPAVEEVARSLGRSSARTFLTVTLRQVRPAATAAGCWSRCTCSATSARCRSCGSRRSPSASSPATGPRSTARPRRSSAACSSCSRSL